MIEYILAFAAVIAAEAALIVVVFKAFGKMSGQLVQQLREDVAQARAYRDGADHHIEKLRKMLIERDEAYGRLLTQPPEERFNAYVKELQDLLNVASNLGFTVSPLLELVRDHEEDHHLDPDYVPLPSDIRAAINDLGKAQLLWGQEKAKYLNRGNGPSPTDKTQMCPSCGREVEMTDAGVPPHRKLYSDIPCDGASSQDTEVDGTT